ncbi:MAG TPA: protein kinase [Ktedonobacteraceae bacterium]|nr:protein kinase [Ktedonobacteraceae bacterium]
MLSLEGKQLGNYEVVRRIRVGGMGAVYEGKQRTAFDRRVAIKVILGDYATDPEMRRRFAREARTIARLHHPHILPLIEFGETQGVLFLVMPFIDGGTLTSHLRHSLPDLSEVAAIYQQLLDAVEYAHDAGLIHRDIKSSNVLLEQRRSGPPYVYLADFGLVRTARQTEPEQVGKPIPLDQVPGTPHYMAPEQTHGIVTPLTDIYALGVLLYQMLTGELPYNDGDDIKVIQMHLYAPIPSPCEHDASIPPELGEVVRTAMAKRPEERYKNVAELRAAFLAAMHGPIAIVQEDDSPLEELQILPPPPKQRASLPLMQDEPPFPAPVPRRVRNVTPPPAIRDPERLRITEVARNRQRITEEPVRRKRKRSRLPLVATMAVPIVLLTLIIMPRILGIGLFPVGFPVLGASPVATIYVTAKSQVVQNRYVLTASPQVQTVDLATHTIPDRIAQVTLTGGSTVKTTGIVSLTGTQSHGTVLFINGSILPITIPAQFILTTSTGVRIRTTQMVEIPPRTEGQNGQGSAPAQAVNPGISGNIAAHALDATCCSNGVSATNPNPFVGGTDGRKVQAVAQADIDNAKNVLTAKLQPEVAQQLRKVLSSDELMAGQPTYNATVSSDSPVGTQADKVQVSVTLTGSVVVYNRNMVSRVAGQLLTQQAAKTLSSPYVLQGTPVIDMPTVVQQRDDGLIYLSVSVHGLWVYPLSRDQMRQWLQSIKGAASEAALAYIRIQTGVGAVQIDLPNGTDRLPSSVDDINIVLVSVQATP